MQNRLIQPNPIPQDILPEFPSHLAYGVLDYSLAVSGDVFRWIIDFAPLDILEKVKPLILCLIIDARERTNICENVAR